MAEYIEKSLYRIDTIIQSEWKMNNTTSNTLNGVYINRDNTL